MSTQNAELPPLDPSKEMPTPTVLHLEENRRAQRAHLVQQGHKKASLAFAGTLLWPRETKLRKVESYRL